LPPTLKTRTYVANVSAGQTTALDVIGGSPQTASATDRAAAGSVIVLAGNSNPCCCFRASGPCLACCTARAVTWLAWPHTPELPPELLMVLPHAAGEQARASAASASVTCRDVFTLVRCIPAATGSLAARDIRGISRHGCR